MATFREMIDRTLDGSKRAGLTDGTEVKALINQAYLEMSALVRPSVTSASVTLTVDVPDYSISADWALTDVVAIRHLKIADSVSAQTFDLERVMTDYILLLRSTQSTNGGNVNYWAQDGLDRVLLYPSPSTTTTALTVTYQARPALLAADADVPAGIPVEFHDTIVLGAIARAVRVWNPNYAADYHREFRLGLQEYRQWANRQGGTWLPKAIVKGGRTNAPMHENDVYYSGQR